MSYPEYPRRGYLEDRSLGVYLHPAPSDCGWGIVTSGGGAFRCPYELIPSSGRILDSEFALVLVVEGKGTFRTESSPVEAVSSGDLLILTPNEWHHYGPEPGGEWTEMWLIFSGHVPEELRDFGKVLARQRRIPLPHAHVWRARFSEIINTIALHAELKESVQGRLAAQILNFLVELRTLERVGWTETSDKKIETVLLDLERDLLTPVDWDQVAASLDMNLSLFRRRFRDYTKFSPHQYLLDLRLRHAKEFLLRSTLSIEQIAREVGYADSTQFSRIFKAKTGVTPSDWKAEHAAKR